MRLAYIKEPPISADSLCQFTPLAEALLLLFGEFYCGGPLVRFIQPFPKNQAAGSAAGV
jgi:hypothetical protein